MSDISEAYHDFFGSGWPDENKEKYMDDDYDEPDDFVPELDDGEKIGIMMNHLEALDLDPIHVLNWTKKEYDIITYFIWYSTELFDDCAISYTDTSGNKVTLQSTLDDIINILDAASKLSTATDVLDSFYNLYWDAYSVKYKDEDKTYLNVQISFMERTVLLSSERAAMHLGSLCSAVNLFHKSFKEMLLEYKDYIKQYWVKYPEAGYVWFWERWKDQTIEKEEPKENNNLLSYKSEIPPDEEIPF